MITLGVDKQWQEAFLKTVQQHENALPLKEAALQERLGDWTKELTSVVVATCEVMGWQASARDHRLDMLPVPRSEYLALDVMAFAIGEKRWRFPAATFELENSKNNDQIAYSLWKLLCVRADLRAVFRYCRNSDEASALVRFLRDEVVHAMELENRVKLEGKNTCCRRES